MREPLQGSRSPGQAHEALRFDVRHAREGCGQQLCDLAPALLVELKRRFREEVVSPANAIGLIVQVMRLSDGKRRVVSITEITGMEGQVVQMQEIFAFRRTGTDADGAVHGDFWATGLRPKCLDEMIRRGIPYDTINFDPHRPLK